jgi:NADH dehydrogenase FAD-containing subunit
VLIAGGGIAGLETVMALSDLGGDQPELTLVAPEPDFVYNCALDRHVSAQETAAPRISRNLALDCSNTARLPAME